MKQQKILWSMLTMIMAAMLSAGFVSCDPDPDPDDNNNVVGTWVGVEPWVGENCYVTSLTLTFKSDGTGTWHEENSDFGTYRDPLTYDMVSQTTGIIHRDESYDSFGEYSADNYPFKVDGNTLYIYQQFSENYVLYVLKKR